MKKFFLIVIASFMMAQLAMAQEYYWPLKSDLKDIKGNLTGTNQGVQFNTDAVRGSVAYFDGNSYAKLPSFIKGNTEITVAVWFKEDEVRPWSRIYSFGKGDQTEPKDVMMVIPVNGAGDPTKNWYRFTLSNAGPWLDADVDTLEAKVIPGKWHYSVMVIKADSVIGYLDNKVIIEEEFARDLTTMDDTDNALGKSFWPDALWKGAMSDLRVYTKALSKSEVTAIYKETKIELPSVSKPQNYWPLKSDLKDINGNLVGTNQGVQFNNDAVRGSVAYFDGNSYAKLPSFIKGNTEITVAVWFKMDEVRPWSRIYSFGKGDQTEPKDVMMVVPVNGAGDPTKNWFRFTLSNAATPWLDADVDTLEAKVIPGKWQYSVMVIKADSVIGYFNNKVIIEEEYAKDLTTMDDTDNALGKSFWPDAFWKGALSDLRVYNRALTKAEVTAIYNETNMISTGIAKLSTTAVSVYSADKSIKVQMKEQSLNAMVSVYDLTGKLMTNKPVSRISEEKFNSGIYIVRVTGSGIFYTTKVFIQ